MRRHRRAQRVLVLEPCRQAYRRHVPQPRDQRVSGKDVLARELARSGPPRRPGPEITDLDGLQGLPAQPAGCAERLRFRGRPTDRVEQ